MATKSKKSIAKQLFEAQLMIHNSIVAPKIKAQVAVFGYSEAKLNEGQALYEAALAAFNLQKLKEGDQQVATSELAQAEASARDAYRALATVARAVFIRDKGRLTALGLDSRMPRTFAGFMSAAHMLFDNASHAATLADYGYDAARLRSEWERIAALDVANRQQEAAKGTAQQSTVDRDAALSALNEWVTQYRKIARVALRGNRELLEELGLAGGVVEDGKV